MNIDTTQLQTQPVPQQIKASTRKNVIIYARYSSDLQNDRSIEDQIASCKAILHPDEQIMHVFEDRAKSGAYMVGRPGIQSLLAEIRAEHCTLIVTEALDRLSRSLEDVAHIYKLAKFHGVQIRTVLEDHISEMHICFNGAMASMQLQQIVERTRRGQIGNIKAGKAGGGLAYGYKVRPLNEAGQYEPGLREIDPEQAAVVRRIYEEYAAGKPVLQIVRWLNESGIPSPRGGKWSPVTITGHYGRKDGILQNALYRGLLVWGRCPETKHPVTAKRQVRIEDSADWVTQEAPHLRIIDDDLWFKAQQMREARRNKRVTHHGFTLFDLKSYCARCSSELIRIEQPYLICAAFKQHHTCSANRRYAITEVTDMLFARLKCLPMSTWRDWVRTCSDTYDKTQAMLSDMEAQLSKEATRLDRLVEALADGLTTSGKVRECIHEAEQAIKTLTSERSALQQCPHPSALDRMAFKAAVKAAKTPDQQKQLVTRVLSSVTLDRDADGNLAITALEPEFAIIAQFANETDQA